MTYTYSLRSMIYLTASILSHLAIHFFNLFIHPSMRCGLYGLKHGFTHWLCRLLHLFLQTWYSLCWRALALEQGVTSKT